MNEIVFSDNLCTSSHGVPGPIHHGEGPVQPLLVLRVWLPRGPGEPHPLCSFHLQGLVFTLSSELPSSHPPPQLKQGRHFPPEQSNPSSSPWRSIGRWPRPATWRRRGTGSTGLSLLCAVLPHYHSSWWFWPWRCCQWREGSLLPRPAPWDQVHLPHHPKKECRGCSPPTQGTPSTFKTLKN